MKVSYSDSLIKFKLVSGLLDREIKENILGGDDKLLEETVKAIEAKESANRAKSKFGGATWRSQGGVQYLLQLQGEQPRLYQGGFPLVSRQEQDMPKMWDQGSL